ncbi:MAG: hypothetical protein WA294_14790 [Acidobacteriaceae bacterium]
MDAGRSILSGDKLTAALFDAYPSLREWRGYRIGLTAALLEVASCVALFLDLDAGIAIPASQQVLMRIRESLLIALLACIPIALIGIFLDKRNIPSAIVLGSILPAFTLLTMCSGYW